MSLSTWTREPSTERLAFGSRLCRCWPQWHRRGQLEPVAVLLARPVGVEDFASRPQADLP